MKRLGVFLLSSPGWDASPLQGYPSIEPAGTNLYTWEEGGSVRVKVHTTEHNTMSLTRARAGDERTNHDGTAPP